MKYSTALSDKLDVIIVKTAMAKPEEFDAVYEKEMADYMSLGGSELKKNWKLLNNKQNEMSVN